MINAQAWPTEIRLHKDRKILTVTFDGGERFDLPAEYLRVKSPSAEVQGHSEQERKTVPGKRNVGIIEVLPVGNYAVRLVFDDLHSTGIFGWDYLLDLGRNYAAYWQDYLDELAAKNPTTGEADVFPQDITRVLLNLISNGFYAATQRKAEADGDDYEPILAAATKSLGDRVEITIRDNGTGIPPDVKEKIFNPFFTTKPAGEGTGLGLSISHDIIVKQHGGSIEVDTQLGEFTEIRVILPRVAA